MDVSIHGNDVLKTSLQGTTPDRAAMLLGRLSAYSEQLRQEPIAVAPVYEADTVHMGGSSHIRLKMGLIEGPSLLQLEEDEKHVAVASLLQRVSLMTTRDGKGTLQVPIDATARNWHLDGDTPTLVDIFPALVRDEEGNMPLVESQWTQGHWAKRYGTQQGVACNVLYSSLSIANTANPNVRLKRALQKVDDWCYDAIPKDMASPVKKSIERQIRYRFIPQLAGTALRVAKNRVVTPISM